MWVSPKIKIFTWDACTNILLTVVYVLNRQETRKKYCTTLGISNCGCLFVLIGWGPFCYVQTLRVVGQEVGAGLIP